MKRERKNNLLLGITIISALALTIWGLIHLIDEIINGRFTINFSMPGNMFPIIILAVFVVLAFLFTSDCLWIEIRKISIKKLKRRKVEKCCNVKRLKTGPRI